MKQGLFNYDYVLMYSYLKFTAAYLRLVDESVDQSPLSIPPYSRGRVEVFVDDTWGTICSTGFDITDAHVICRQLGFPAASSYNTDARYGQGSGRILASNLDCLGSESNIDQCESSAPVECSHSMDVGVDCIGKNIIILYNVLPLILCTIHNSC